MATMEPVTIGGGGEAGRIFVGTDKKIELAIRDKNGALRDVTGFTFNFSIKTTVNASTATLEKAATIEGVFADESQRVVVDFTDTDLGADKFSAKTYQYSLKRIDDGSEDIYAYGDFIVEKATQV